MRRRPMQQRKGRIAALLGALGVAATLVLALVFREDLWAGYLRYRWSKIDAVVLDDCDPDYKSPGPRGDAIRFLDAKGNLLFRLGGLNNCETVGANHGVALDPERFRIYLREIVGRRITALDSTGRVLFKVEDVDAGALAVDPGSGNLWCAAGHSLDQGEVLVFDTSGARVALHPIVGFDIAYSPHDQAFWVVGYGVTKCDREGRALVQIPKLGRAVVSVAPDPRDGGAWVAERDHDGMRSRNKILRLDAGGTVTREIALGAQHPFCVSCDPETGMAWLVEMRKSVLRLPVEGPPLPPIALPAVAISIGSRKGGIWVSAKDAVYKLNPDGTTAATHELAQASSQSWIAAP